MRLKAGLIGDPVSHSRSPRIFAALGADYQAVRVPAAKIRAALEALALAGFRGVNVTIPHKKAALALSSSSTPEARAVGAANVLLFQHGLVVAHNTDAAGFLDQLAELGFDPRGKTAVVFGAGGAAMAVLYALGKARAASVRVSARNSTAARLEARRFSRLFSRTEFSAGKPSKAAVWINATPLGMKGYPNKAPFSGKARCDLAVDLVYGRATRFLREARKAGARSADGTSLLLFQALRSWEFWTGKKLPASRRRALKSSLLKELA